MCFCRRGVRLCVALAFLQLHIFFSITFAFCRRCAHIQKMVYLLCIHRLVYLRIGLRVLLCFCAFAAEMRQLLNWCTSASFWISADPGSCVPVAAGLRSLSHNCCITVFEAFRCSFTIYICIYIYIYYFFCLICFFVFLGYTFGMPEEAT